MKVIYGLILCTLILLSGCARQAIVGNDSDQFGCKPSAGFAWNETIGACARSWELDIEQAEAARIAAASITEMPKTVITVEALRCPACFRVDIQKGINDERISIIVRDGRIDPEYNDADVKEHVCTEQESLATACTMEYAPVCGKIILNIENTKYQTFGNGCSACAAMKVVSYTQGECS